MKRYVPAAIAAIIIMAVLVFGADAAKAQTMSIEVGWMQSISDPVAIHENGTVLAVADMSEATPFRYGFVTPNEHCIETSETPGLCEPCGHNPMCRAQLGGARMELPDLGEPYRFTVQGQVFGSTPSMLLTDLREVTDPMGRITGDEPEVAFVWQEGEFTLRKAEWWSMPPFQENLRSMLDSVEIVSRDRLAEVQRLEAIIAEGGGYDPDAERVIQELQEEIDTIRDLITQLESQHEAETAALSASLAAAQSERDAAVASRDEAQSALSAAISERDAAVAARVEAENALAPALAERDAAIADRDAAIAARDQAVATIESLRDQVEELEHVRGNALNQLRAIAADLRTLLN